MDTKRLLEIINNTTSTSHSYSRRGWHGKECVSVIVDHGTLRWLASAIEECDNVHEAGWLVRYAKTDDRGLSIIIYWPTIEWPQDREAERSDALEE